MGLRPDLRLRPHQCGVRDLSGRMRDIYLLKFGGNALDGAEGLRRLAHEVAELVEKKIAVVMVHGGGP
ncbi:MAG: hypothetical protein II518_02790, partial [Candidatus Methanomethylophilus sp.]|nr:hypothetical protein [Methanomethylophilus sp.]